MEHKKDQYIISKEKLIGRISVKVTTDLVGHEELCLLKEVDFYDEIELMVDKLLAEGRKRLREKS